MGLDAIAMLRRSTARMESRPRRPRAHTVRPRRTPTRSHLPRAQRRARSRRTGGRSSARDDRPAPLAPVPGSAAAGSRLPLRHGTRRPPGAGEEREQHRCAGLDLRPKLSKQRDTASASSDQRVCTPADDQPVVDVDARGNHIPGRVRDRRLVALGDEQLVGGDHEVRLALPGIDPTRQASECEHLPSATGRHQCDRPADAKMRLDRPALPVEQPLRVVVGTGVVDGACPLAAETHVVRIIHRSRSCGDRIPSQNPMVTDCINRTSRASYTRDLRKVRARRLTSRRRSTVRRTRDRCMLSVMSRPSANPTATGDVTESRRIRDEAVYVRRRHGKAVRRALEVRHSCHDVSMLIVRRRVRATRDPRKR